MDVNILLLWCTVLVIPPVHLQSISKAQGRNLLEDIQMEWKNRRYTTSVAELKGCFSVLQELEDSTEATTNKEGIVISRVCQRNVTHGSLINIIKFCKVFSFFQNISVFILEQPNEVTSNIYSLSFIDSHGEYKVSSHFSSAEGSGDTENEDLNEERITPFCISDPRAEQLFIRAVSSPKLLIIMDLLTTHILEGVRSIEELVNTIVTFSEDYVALLSSSTVTTLNTYSGLIREASFLNISELLDSIVRDVGRQRNPLERGYDWVNHTAILNFLTHSSSMGRISNISCQTVLTIFIDDDLPGTLVDTLLEASTANTNLKTVVYNVGYAEQTVDTGTSRLTNVERLLCERKIYYEDIPSDYETRSRFLDTLNFLTFQGAQARQSAMWDPEWRHKTCISVYDDMGLAPVLPEEEDLEVFAGLMCLEMKSNLSNPEYPIEHAANSSCHEQLSFESSLSQCVSFIRQVLTSQPSRYALCPSFNPCSQHISPATELTLPILSHLSLLFSLSISLTANANSCPRGSSYLHLSCLDDGRWTKNKMSEGELNFLRPFSYEFSSVFFANRSLEEALILDSNESEKYVDLQESLCASSYLDASWNLLTSLIPQFTFQYFDYNHNYIRFYPGYQMTNQTCSTGNTNVIKEFPSPGKEIFISDMTGNYSTRYCQPALTSSSGHDQLSGMLCITVPMAILDSSGQPDPLPSQAVPVFLEVEETVEDNISPSSLEEEISPTTTNDYNMEETDSILMPFMSITENTPSMSVSSLDLSSSALLSFTLSSNTPYTSIKNSPVSISNLATLTSLDLNPTPSPIISAAMFLSEAEHTLNRTSKQLREAYNMVLALGVNESCPYDNQLMDGCASSCRFAGSGEDLCSNLFGGCQESTNVSITYAPERLHKVLMEYNYSIENLQQHDKVPFAHLCTAQSLNSLPDSDRYHINMLKTLPFSSYFIDAQSGFMSLLPDSDCSLDSNSEVCKNRNFDGRQSLLYRKLLVNLRDILLAVHIKNKSNFDEMQNISLDLVNLLPEESLKAIYFQSNETTKNFSSFIRRIKFYYSDLVFTKIRLHLIYNRNNNNSSRNLSVILLTDSCLGNSLNPVFEQFSADIFVYTFGKDCKNPTEAQEIACSNNGDWQRIGNCSSEECRTEQTIGFEIISSYFRFYPTVLSSIHTVVWNEAGIKDSTRTENRTLSACVPIPSCPKSGASNTDVCASSMDLLGIACMEFDRNSFNSLEGNGSALQRALDKSKMMLEGRRLSKEERERVRSHPCTTMPTPEVPFTIPFVRPTPYSPKKPDTTATQHPPISGRSRRIKSGYIAAIVIGIVAMTSGSICIAYWVCMLCTEMCNKKRRHYRSNDCEDDPFSTNYKRLHENITNDEQEGL